MSRSAMGDFTFNDIDFAAFATFTGSQTLMVEGLLGGSPVGTDQYTLANTNNTSTGKYANWTTEAASVLAGISVSELDIPLNVGVGFLEAMDNVVLTPVSACQSQPRSRCSPPAF